MNRITYQQAMLYFLSGTGNTYRVATWVAERLQGAGISTETASIQAGDLDAQFKPNSDTLLVLAMPVHAFIAPWLMMRFVWHLPRGKGTDALIVAANSGVSGTTFYVMALLLWLKGYTVRSFLDVPLPDNWMSLVPGAPEEKARATVAQAREKTDAFMDGFLAGKRSFLAWPWALLALVLLPVGVGYLILGRFFLAKLFFASERCIGCGQCAAHCPWRAIKMVERAGQRRPYWTFNCESCMRCMAFCPTQAIEAGHSWGVLLAAFTFIPVVNWVLNGLTQQIPALADVRGLLWVLLAYGYTLLVFVIAYALFTVLLRVPAINRFFTGTTLTHYYRRYHEPDTSLKDLSL
ncbi:MAG TPA: EFR1 family ferrodoxin [Anaerolineae bacterium]|nr:EFR1 family ferrodoxin [Anaerolineae bacterium]HQI83872.1 EFR1 family ferrodoxin [Anaerolineae bacterium]